jgi:hypothetical protein
MAEVQANNEKVQQLALDEGLKRLRMLRQVWPDSLFQS